MFNKILLRRSQILSFNMTMLQKSLLRRFRENRFNRVSLYLSHFANNSKNSNKSTLPRRFSNL